MMSLNTKSATIFRLRLKLAFMSMMLLYLPSLIQLPTRLASPKIIPNSNQGHFIFTSRQSWTTENLIKLLANFEQNKKIWKFTQFVFFTPPETISHFSDCRLGLPVVKKIVLIARTTDKFLLFSPLTIFCFLSHCLASNNISRNILYSMSFAQQLKRKRSGKQWQFLQE